VERHSNNLQYAFTNEDYYLIGKKRHSYELITKIEYLA